MTLTDGVIAVRPWAPDDYEALARLSRDPVIQRWTTVPAGNTPAMVRDFHASGAEEPFVITDAASGEILGAIGLKPGPELGYWVAAAHRGRGIAPRAVRLLADWAFAHRGARTMEIRILAANGASRRVAERAGFALVEEGEWAVYRRAAVGSGGDG